MFIVSEYNINVCIMDFLSGPRFIAQEQPPNQIHYSRCQRFDRCCLTVEVAQFGGGRLHELRRFHIPSSLVSTMICYFQ